MEETQRLWGYDPLISPYEFLADGDEPDYGHDDFTAEELACLNRTFADILSDEGFKAVFYSADNSDLLVELVNVMLNGCRRATRLIHLRNEFSAPSSDGRRSWLDITCIDENGNLFDVEVQRRSTGSTFRRFVSYACKTYELGLQFENRKEERERTGNRYGGKDVEPSKFYRLKPTYVIVILESKPNTEEGVTYGQRLYSHYTMKEIHTNEVAPSTINIIFASLAFFDKKADECTTDFDRWCYMFKHLGELTDAPEGFLDKVMCRLMSAARIANFNRKQKKLYINVAMDKEYNKELIYEAWVGGKKAGREEGREEGRKEGRKIGIMDTARIALLNGIAPELVAKITGMNLESVLALR